LFGRLGGLRNKIFIDPEDERGDQEAETNGGPGDLPEIQTARAHDRGFIVAVEMAVGELGRYETGERRGVHQDHGEIGQIIVDENSEGNFAVNDFIQGAGHIHQDIKEGEYQDSRYKNGKNGSMDVTV